MGLNQSLKFNVTCDGCGKPLSENYGNAWQAINEASLPPNEVIVTMGVSFRCKECVAAYSVSPAPSPTGGDK